jgi:hypothetical protein
MNDEANNGGDTATLPRRVASSTGATGLREDAQDSRRADRGLDGSSTAMSLPPGAGGGVIKNELLITFWITFPGPAFEHSYGVTAYSLDDALALLRKHQLARHELDKPMQVRENIRIQDLDQGHIAPNCGPLVFRGVWFPCSNLGTEAP